METIRSDEDKGIDISIKRYAHMFISVVAYHIMHAIEHRLHQKKDSRTWKTIKNLLKTHIYLKLGLDASHCLGNYC